MKWAICQRKGHFQKELPKRIPNIYQNVSQVLLVSVQGNTIATEYNNLSKYIMHILLDSSILLLRSYPDTCEQRCIYKHTHCSVVCKCQKSKQPICLSTGEWLNSYEKTPIRE